MLRIRNPSFACNDGYVQRYSTQVPSPGNTDPLRSTLSIFLFRDAELMHLIILTDITASAVIYIICTLYTNGLSTKNILIFIASAQILVHH